MRTVLLPGFFQPPLWILDVRETEEEEAERSSHSEGSCVQKLRHREPGDSSVQKVAQYLLKIKRSRDYSSQ